jgi:hypothetical protein
MQTTRRLRLPEFARAMSPLEWAEFIGVVHEEIRDFGG